MREFNPGEKVRHFKGGVYEIVCIAKHTENQEKLMIYKSGVTETCFARPYDMFTGKVDKEKYPNIKQEYRLKKISDEEYNKEIEDIKSARMEMQKHEK